MMILPPPPRHREHLGVLLFVGLLLAGAIVLSSAILDGSLVLPVPLP